MKNVLIIIVFVIVGLLAGYICAAVFAPRAPDPIVIVPGEDMSSYNVYGSGATFTASTQNQSAIPFGEVHARNMKLSSTGDQEMVSYDTSGGDSPTIWSPAYLSVVPEVSMTIFHRPSGGDERLTLVARGGKAEFHDFDVMVKNRDSFMRFLMFSVPIGAIVGGFVGLGVVIWKRKKPTSQTSLTP